MTPSSVSPNSLDCLAGNSEFPSELVHGKPPLTFVSNRSDLRFFELSEWAFFPWLRSLKTIHESHRDRMEHVFASRNIFEVLRTVISFYSVLVINLFPFWQWTDKSCCYETMDKEECANAIPVQGHSEITARVRNEHFKLPNPDLPDASNMALSRYLVKSFVANYRFPEFHFPSVL